MRRLTLCCLTFSLLIFAAKKDRAWRIGKVTDSNMSDSDSNNLIVVGSDFIYTARDSTPRGGVLTRALANRTHGCRFIVGDAIKYAQNGNRSLYVLDADGKECTLDIVRQERLK